MKKLLVGVIGLTWALAAQPDGIDLSGLEFGGSRLFALSCDPAAPRDIGYGGLSDRCEDGFNQGMQMVEAALRRVELMSEIAHLPFAMHLILFDIDGTLVDSHEFDGEMYVQAVRAVLGIGIDDDWAAYRHVTDGGILDEIMDKAGVKADRSPVQAEVRETFAELIADYLHVQKEPLAEVPGAGAFLAGLQSRPQVAIGLATGGWEETARMKLGAVGLDPDAFPLASGSDAVSRVEIMQIAEQRALGGRKANRRTYFGDGTWDRKASLELGYDFIAIGDKVEHLARYPDFH